MYLRKSCSICGRTFVVSSVSECGNGLSCDSVCKQQLRIYLCVTYLKMMNYCEMKNRFATNRCYLRAMRDLNNLLSCSFSLRQRLLISVHSFSWAFLTTTKQPKWVRKLYDWKVKGLIGEECRNRFYVSQVLFIDKFHVKIIVKGKVIS